VTKLARDHYKLTGNMTAADAKVREQYFARFSLGEFKALRDHWQWRTVQPGETILQQGQAVSHLFLVVDGNADVVSGTTVLGKVKEGRFLGEMAYFSGDPASVSIRATTAMTFIVWTMDDILRLTHLHGHSYEASAFQKLPSLFCRQLTATARDLTTRAATVSSRDTAFVDRVVSLFLRGGETSVTELVTPIGSPQPRRASKSMVVHRTPVVKVGGVHEHDAHLKLRGQELKNRFSPIPKGGSPRIQPLELEKTRAKTLETTDTLLHSRSEAALPKPVLPKISSAAEQAWAKKEPGSPVAVAEAEAADNSRRTSRRATYQGML
jgi:CRP-like cAMP-binding protein